MKESAEQLERRAKGNPDDNAEKQSTYAAALNPESDFPEKSAQDLSGWEAPQDKARVFIIRAWNSLGVGHANYLNKHCNAL